VTAKKLISTEDLALLVGGEDIIYRLLFYCVFNRLKGERRGGTKVAVKSFARLVDGAYNSL
jgi:hypothetical protein